MDIERFDKLGEECGVFGVYDFDGNDVASTIYYGLRFSTGDRRAAESRFPIPTVRKGRFLPEKVWDYVMKSLLRNR